MKQKMVIKVQMTCDKDRKKAMTLASLQGVESVAIAGGDKDHLVVVGESIDPVKLVRNLRKKVGHADIISMNKVNSDSDEDEDDDESERKQIVEYMPRLWYPNNYSPYIMYR